MFSDLFPRNDWRLLGTYDYLRWGEIAPHHISLLPPFVLNTWVNGALSSQWGKSWIEKANEKFPDARKVNFTQDGLSQALHDGRLVIPFTILQCVGYPEDWFERLLYYEENPKPPKSKNGKRRGPKAQGTPKKRAKTQKKGKHQIKEESEDEADEYRQGGEEFHDSDSEYDDGPRRIAMLPKRTSPRKLTRAQSIEL